MSDQSEQIVDLMGQIHGVHAGHRSVHAKGSCCLGTFVATADAAKLCVAAHFQGDEVPVTVRFSNGTGRPDRADGAKDERGMAVKFHLPNGKTTDIVSLTLPAFFVRTPEDFLEFLGTQVPDPATGKPDVAKTMAFVAEHPEAQKAIGFLMLSPAPASYANCTFFGIHAFRMTGPDDEQRWVRYRFVPEAGEATLTDPETRALGRDYLRDDIASRFDNGPVVYDLLLQIAEEGDDPDDPTEPWPEERELVNVGRLTLTECVRGSDRDCEHMIFDPNRLTEGIQASADKILAARSPAYGVSYSRRT